MVNYDQEKLDTLMKDIGRGFIKLIERDAENIADVINIEDSMNEILKHYIKDGFSIK